MDHLNLADLNLSQEESRNLARYLVEHLAKMRNIKNYKRKSNDKLLRAIKKNKNNKQQSKNKERMDDIRKDLKDLSHKLSRSELKEIKKNFYNIEKRKQFD